MNLPSLRLNVGSVDIRQIFAGRFRFSNSSSFWCSEPIYGLCSLFSGVIMVLCFFSKVKHSEPIICSGSLQIFLGGLRSLHITHTLGTLGNTSSMDCLLYTSPSPRD